MNFSNISYDRFTKSELRERFMRSDKHNKRMGFACLTFDQFIIQFYPSYMKELGIKSNILNESASCGAGKVAEQEVNDHVLASRDVSESASLPTRKDSEGHASLVQPFNKKEYQRQLMRDRRAKAKKVLEL